MKLLSANKYMDLQMQIKREMKHNHSVNWKLANDFTCLHTFVAVSAR